MTKTANDKPQTEGDPIAELEADIPPEEVDAWLEAFLRERVE